jgi:hypothetical protein
MVLKVLNHLVPQMGSSGVPRTVEYIVGFLDVRNVTVGEAVNVIAGLSIWPYKEHLEGTHVTV